MNDLYFRCKGWGAEQSACLLEGVSAVVEAIRRAMFADHEWSAANRLTFIQYGAGSLDLFHEQRESDSLRLAVSEGKSKTEDGACWNAVQRKHHHKKRAFTPTDPPE